MDKFAASVEKARATHGDRYEYLEYIAGSRAKNTRTSLRILCKEHGEFVQAVTHHVNGSGCTACGYLKTTKNMTFTLEQWVAKAKLIHGDRYSYEGLEEGIKPPALRILCKEHGLFVTSAPSHTDSKRPNGCPKCGHSKISEALSFSEEQTMAQLIAKDSSKVYLKVRKVGKERVFTGVCDRHGEFNKSVKVYLRGNHYCPKCGREAIGESKKHTFSRFVELANEVHDNKYTYLGFTEAGEGRVTVSINCPKHGEFSQDKGMHLYGNGCPKCSSRVSKANVRLGKFVESLGLKAELEKKLEDKLGAMFVDLYVPEKNLVIEHHGLRWHSSRFRPCNDTYTRKARLEALGLSVMVIFEDELSYRQSNVFGLISARLGKSPKALYARKLSVRPLQVADCSKFLDTYHIQGATNKGDAVGLFNSEKLVAVAVFDSRGSNRSRNSDTDTVELTRFCSSVPVNGGLSRLAQAFLRLNTSVQVLESFSDNRLFTGNAYEASGFRKVFSSKQDYSYVVGKRRKHKAGFQKSRLLKLYHELDPSMTELEMTESLGLYRIYDAGKTKWELRR